MPIEIKFERRQPLNSDKQKIINYLKSAKIKEIRNKYHLFEKLSDIFRKEPDYIKDIWSDLEKDYPDLVKRVVSKFQDEILKQKYEQANYESLHPKRKVRPTTETFPESVTAVKNESLNLKETKRIDGLEFEWKEGKMSPADQKTYRSKFDDQ
jgi:hypothetical protein